ncbi:DUF4192 domain-containing protein [Streptomyces sp. Da 82-17]|uniref:DUF4192 domain-containing protein n=1 Tax=Streptomyces sp. Da 82-17 TaxID=3377116 RepID=UPI0038D505DA
MTNHFEAADGPGKSMKTRRNPAELADTLPYLMGFHPDDSVVLVTKHGGQTFGGRVRLGIPEETEDWPSIADQLVGCLLVGAERYVDPPAAVVVYVCQDPRGDETPQQVMERLRPLVEQLLAACRSHGLLVEEALCISARRYWSYVCPDTRCCPPAGTPMALPGTSVTAAAATYAGLPTPTSLRQMQDRYAAPRGEEGTGLKNALDAAASSLVPRVIMNSEGDQVEEETLEAAARIMQRFREAPPVGGVRESDRRDDQLIGDREGAELLVGLQVRETRDRAAEWMEGDEAALALRLWRALARRCVPPYMEFATAPLSLAGWVAWSLDDEPEARVALGLALDLDPLYRFAQLLHAACSQGLDVEEVRRCLRTEAHPPRQGPERESGSGPGAKGARGPQPALPQEQPESEARSESRSGPEPVSTSASASASASRGEKKRCNHRSAVPEGQAEAKGPDGATNRAGRRVRALPPKTRTHRRAAPARARRKGRPRPGTRTSLHSPVQIPRQLRRSLVARAAADVGAGGTAGDAAEVKLKPTPGSRASQRGPATRSDDDARLTKGGGGEQQDEQP